MKFSAYEFAKATEARINALSMKQYHERPRDAKRLIEEIYPLSRFALALTKPGLDVEVEALENSKRLDGHIWTSGFLDQSFDVEVTFAGYERLEKLRSRLMLRQGFTPGAGPIEQDKKTGEIIATMEAEDGNAPITRLAESICKRVYSKAAKTYAPGTILLIAFEDMRLEGRGLWKPLHSAIDNAGGIERGAFAKLYLFNSCSNDLQRYD